MSRILDHPILGPLGQRKKVRIEFEGQIMEAHQGESVAAALLAGGVRVLRYTAKSGSPRSLYCAIGRCTDCVVVVDDVWNVRACVTPVREGMRIRRQQGLGGVGAARKGCGSR